MGTTERVNGKGQAEWVGACEARRKPNPNPDAEPVPQVRNRTDGKKRVTSKPCSQLRCVADSLLSATFCPVLDTRGGVCMRVVVRLFRGGKAGVREAGAEVAGTTSRTGLGKLGKARQGRVGVCWGVPRNCKVPRRSLEPRANQTRPYWALTKR